MSRVAIVGAGYVGLVSGACFAELGHEVTVVDVDADRIAAISQGESPIWEPGLDRLLAEHAGQRLSATTDLRRAVRDADMTFIAVGTPAQANGAIDLTHVTSAATEIGDALRGTTADHVVIVKSTVVPGTTQELVAPTVAASSGRSPEDGVTVAVNPEFLTEGRAVRDFLEPDRIVIGAPDDPAITERVASLYAGLRIAPPILSTTPTTAEMIKYASNALLATAISFSNEIANLCASLPDTDVVDVMHGVHLSQYLSRLEEQDGATLAPLSSYLEAGCGFGGSCLPKDVRALIAHGRERGVATPILNAVLDVNARRAVEVAHVLSDALGSLDSAVVTVLGLAFKPDTDDVRETPALPLIRLLRDAGAQVTAHDPVVRALPPGLEGDVNVMVEPDLDRAVDNADAVVIVTRWPQYEELPNILRRMERPPVIVDGRRMLDKASIEKYAGVGLGPSKAQ